MYTLTVADVVAIHEVLVADFAGSNDPISPPGIRSMDLLESAVSRQFTGDATRLKYPDPIPNAATLTFGICSDHPFHNGNKRAALVAMLVHLDGNQLALFGTKENDLFSMILGVAEHTLGLRRDPRKGNQQPPRRSADEEVQAINDWIRKRADRLERGERLIRYRELRTILSSFYFYLENPHNNSIDIVRYEEEVVGPFFKKRVIRTKKRVMNIGYPGDDKEVPRKFLKSIRSNLGLTEENGVDSEAFYKRTAIIDAFVNKYRSVLRRLAKY